MTTSKQGKKHADVINKSITVPYAFYEQHDMVQLGAHPSANAEPGTDTFLHASPSPAQTNPSKLKCLPPRQKNTILRTDCFSTLERDPAILNL